LIRSTLVAVLCATLAGTVLGLPAAKAAPQAPTATSLESARAAFEAKQTTVRVAPSQLLVKFPEGTPVATIQRVAQEMGGSLIEMVTPDGLAKVRVDPFVDVRDAMRRWKERPDVQYAAPNVIAHAFAVPNDTTIATYDLKWNLRQVGAFDAWDYVTADPRIVVAIIDSGVAFEDYPIPAYEIANVWPGTTMYLQSPELPGPFVPGWDFVNNDAHPDDDYSHGTFVATILAGAANNVTGSCGVAFGVTIMPVKVLDFQGDAESDHIVQGIRFAADHGATIINLSLGYPPLPLFLLSGYTLQQIMDIFIPLGDAIAYAQNKGCLIVASAGNFAFDEVSYPAAFPGVIACGATGVDGSRSSFSSYGKDLDFMAPGGEFLDVNNDHIQDAVPAYSMKPNRSPGSLAKPDSFGLFFSFGTSESAPHVAGAAALLMSAGATDENTIVRVLRETAVTAQTYGQHFNPGYGWGLIQIDKAVRQVARARHLTRWEPLAPQGADLRVVTENPGAGPVEAQVRTAKPGPVTARVYDVRGALVRTIRNGPAPAGISTLRWDGRDNRGSASPAGIYFLRVETPSGRASQKVVLLR